MDNPDLKPSLSELSSPESDREGSSDVDGEKELLPVETGRKRRRNAQDESSGRGGRVPNGKDFWSSVDSWFKDGIKK